MEAPMTLHKVLVGALLLVFGCLCTAQKAEIKTVPIKHVDPSSGEKMYVTYCAVCHGTDGTVGYIHFLTGRGVNMLDRNRLDLCLLGGTKTAEDKQKRPNQN